MDLVFSENYERRERRNTILERYFLLFLCINLHEGDLACPRKLSRKMLVQWIDSLARSAPVRIDYNHDCQRAELPAVWNCDEQSATRILDLLSKSSN